MNISPLESQIRAYLNYQMPPDERAAFELLLRTDKTASDTYIQFCMKGDGVDSVAKEEVLRKHALAFRERIGPLPEPKISWLDRLRIVWYAYPIRTGLLALLTPTVCILTGAFIWANTIQFPDARESAFLHRIKPPCVDIKASTKREVEISAKRKLFEKAANIYCSTQSGKVDSLQTMAEANQPFSFADYYLAHSFLDSSQWTSARVIFEQCLKNADSLKGLEETRDIEALRLNLLLARMGENNRYEDIKADLAKLIEDLPKERLVCKEAISLRNEMERPLRWFNVR